VWTVAEITSEGGEDVAEEIAGERGRGQVGARLWTPSTLTRVVDGCGGEGTMAPGAAGITLRGGRGGATMATSRRRDNRGADTGSARLGLGRIAERRERAEPCTTQGCGRLQ
jgi:hypothetical protein